MTTPKFTPGPWTWNYIYYQGRGYYQGRVKRVENGAQLFGNGEQLIIDHAMYEGMWFAAYDPEKDEANARLIAAAPDLFYALLGLIDEHEEFFSSVDKTETISNARKAIAKALGQDQS